MILRPFEYVESKTVDDAVAALQSGAEDARIIAGGTALVPLMKHSVLRPSLLVSIARVPGFAEIAPDVSGGLRIGTVTTHWAVSHAALVQERSPLLAYACSRVASPTVRSMGTLGGNLCQRNRMLLLVLGTSSSETALPTLMEKLQTLGCSKSLVGLVVPTGYTFNTDGSRSPVKSALSKTSASSRRSVRVDRGALQPLPVLEGGLRGMATPEMSFDKTQREAKSSTHNKIQFEDRNQNESISTSNPIEKMHRKNTSESGQSSKSQVSDASQGSKVFVPRKEGML
jgi:hypothetical protein